MAWAGHDLALLALERDDTDGAEPLLRQSLRQFESLDYDWAVALCSSLLASVLVRGGTAAEIDEAAALLARPSPCTTASATGAGSRRAWRCWPRWPSRAARRRPRPGSPERQPRVATRCDVAPTEGEAGGWPTSTRGCSAVSGLPAPTTNGTPAGRCRPRRCSSWRAG